ncbi:MAG TPA: hypothetical protein VFV50_13400, partial [Bdellovibrionales bacterium]|nr:hypothetical protein [Bdellovibrionales bacterium]
AAGTAYASSPAGRALYGYILLKNGMPTLAFETLFQVSKPEAIPGELRALWAAAVSTENPIWLYADYKWKSSWQIVFGKDLQLRKGALENASLKNARELKKAEQLLTRTTAHTPEWARLHWQLATSKAILDQNSQAQRHLQTLLASKQKVIGRDQILMAIGRLHFQRNQFQDALSAYNQVSKASDYWLEALEEKAWTYIRLGDYRKALGQLETVLTPVFAAELGPEPYFVRSFSNLKICDFQSVFKTHDEFKSKYRQRTLDLQALAQTGQSPALSGALSKMMSGATRWSQFGPDVEKLPRFFHRDQSVDRLMQRARALAAEKTQLANLVASVRDEYASTRMEDSLGRNQIDMNNKIAAIQMAVTAKVRKLANAELEEISRILRKLHIVEAESIQRLHLYDKDAARAETKFADVGDSDTLVFPADGEVWLDELDHYEVNAAGCPAPKKRGG